MEEKILEINIFTDGGSRGNPGSCAIGVFITDDVGNKLFELGKKIGYGTNNFAEYNAILEGFNWISKNLKMFKSLQKINFYMDSQLATSQLNGLYKVKNAQIRDYILKVRLMESSLNYQVNYYHIPREKNKKADSLVNLALDNKLKLT